MQIFQWQLGKLWTVVPNVLSIWIGLLRLTHWMAFYTCEPLRNACEPLVLPHHGIYCNVGIGKANMEPFFALHPRGPDDLHKKLPHNVSQMLLEVTSLAELTHCSIDKWPARRSALPCTQSHAVI
jgi:hypothetical protein